MHKCRKFVIVNFHVDPFSDTADVRLKLGFIPRTIQHLWCGSSSDCGDRCTSSRPIDGM
jgi:hypothetical protein